MRKLFLTRGVAGSGKSTTIRKMGLEDWALCSDKIRLMYSSPVLNDEARFSMPNSKDSECWNTLYAILEDRMASGETTIVDATNIAGDTLNRYKNLAIKYN